MLDGLLESRYDLDASAAIADDSDSLVFEVDSLIPLRGMKQWSLEVMQSFDLGPLPLVQNTSSIDKNMAPIRVAFLRQLILNFDDPIAFVIIPFRLDKSRVELDVVLASVFVREVLEVLANLGSIRIVVAPVPSETLH
jgi:hypothetical protein